MKRKFSIIKIERNAYISFSHMTYKKYRFLFLTEEYEKKIVVLGLIINEMPSGLLVCSLDNSTARILSIYIIKSARKKGFGALLFKELENLLKEMKIEKITVEFIRDGSGSIHALEKIIAGQKWISPEIISYICKIKTNVLYKSPWFSKYSLPEDYSIFFWKDIKDHERNKIIEDKGKPGSYPEYLDPFPVDKNIEYLNSLGLRYKDEVIGWIIVERINDNALSYMRLFVKPEFQNLGRIIVMLCASVKIQYDNKIKYGCFTFDVANKQMSLFYKKRFKPYVLSEIFKVFSYKILTK